MDHKLQWRKADLEEQLDFPWEWVNAQYRNLDGWNINKNRISKDKYLQEMSKDFGPITIPHRER